MKKLCKLNKKKQELHLEHKGGTFKCKKCGLRSECKKSLCKGKLA